MVRVVTDKQGLMELMKHLMKREGIKNKLTVKKSGGLYKIQNKGKHVFFGPLHSFSLDWPFSNR